MDQETAQLWTDDTIRLIVSLRKADFTVILPEPMPGLQTQRSLSQSLSAEITASGLWGAQQLGCSY